MSDLKIQKARRSSSHLLKSGERVVFRTLEMSDKENLLAFLNNLSVETKSKFGLSIWEYIDSPEMLHMVLVNQAGKIIGCIILSFGLRDSQVVRYKDYGISLEQGCDMCIAPVVADLYQNKGVGTIMLGESIRIAKSLGVKHIILWQGTQVTNTNAIYFYEKFGFKKNGEFQKYGNYNVDMTLTLQ